MPKATSDTLVDVGVDYITATYVGRAQESSLPAFGKYLISQESEAGEVARPFRFSGYNGMHAGSVSWGVRHDGAVIRASSHVAKEHWQQIYSLATNVTRLDVQVTVRPDGGPTKRLAKHHRELRRGQRSRGRPAKFKFWYGPCGPEAAVLGKRTSDMFGRIYDKGLESGLPELLGTLRYEAELKRLLAKNFAAELDHGDDMDHKIIQFISALVHRRGLRIPAWSDSSRLSSSEIRCQALHNVVASFAASDECINLGRGTARRQSLWLYNAVRPTAQKFLNMGKSDVLLEALGLSIENNSLVQRSSETWTDFKNWR